MFLHLSVNLFTGGVWKTAPPADTTWADTLPPGRHPPSGDISFSHCIESHLFNAIKRWPPKAVLHIQYIHSVVFPCRRNAPERVASCVCTSVTGSSGPSQSPCSPPRTAENSPAPPQRSSHQSTCTIFIMITTRCSPLHTAENSPAPAQHSSLQSTRTIFIMITTGSPCSPPRTAENNPAPPQHSSLQSTCTIFIMITTGSPCSPLHTAENSPEPPQRSFHQSLHNVKLSLQFKVTHVTFQFPTECYGSFA